MTRRGDAKISRLLLWHKQVNDGPLIRVRADLVSHTESIKIVQRATLAELIPRTCELVFSWR